MSHYSGSCIQVLKETLIRHGFTFESETDTEVIPKLAKLVYDKANEVEGKFYWPILDISAALDQLFVFATCMFTTGALEAK